MNQEDIYLELINTIKGIGDKNMYSFILISIVLLCATLLKAVNMCLHEKYNFKRLKYEEDKVNNEIIRNLDN